MEDTHLHGLNTVIKGCLHNWFCSYKIFMAFFDFFGPVVNQLHYWGSREGTCQRRHSQKVDPKISFLTLVKLRLNLKLEDLSFRDYLRSSLVSQYLTTWICFFIIFYGNRLDATSRTSEGNITISF